MTKTRFAFSPSAEAELERILGPRSLVVLPQIRRDVDDFLQLLNSHEEEQQRKASSGVNPWADDLHHATQVFFLADYLLDRRWISKDAAYGIAEIWNFLQKRSEESDAVLRERKSGRQQRRGRPRRSPHSFLALSIAAAMTAPGGELPSASPGSPFFRVLAIVLRELGQPMSSVAWAARRGLERFKGSLAYAKWLETHPPTLTARQQKQRRTAAKRSARKRAK